MTYLLAPTPGKDILTPPSANNPNIHKNTHTNSTKYHEVVVAFSTPYRRDGCTKPKTASQKNKDTNDTQMVDNPYNVEDIRERLLNNVISIKFERDRYTTPITIEFFQQQEKESINPAKLNRDLFAEILLIGMQSLR